MLGVWWASIELKTSDFAAVVISTGHLLYWWWLHSFYAPFIKLKLELSVILSMCMEHWYFWSIGYSCFIWHCIEASKEELTLILKSILFFEYDARDISGIAEQTPKVDWKDYFWSHSCCIMTPRTRSQSRISSTYCAGCNSYDIETSLKDATIPRLIFRWRIGSAMCNFNKDQADCRVHIKNWRL